MRAALIVNPYASRVTEAALAAVERELGRAAEVATLRTERPGHAAELVAALADVDAIVVFSGDGGFNEALNGSGGAVPLGFVPGGGTSVLPRALGLPREPVAAARRIAEALAAGRVRRLSLGRVNGRRFAFAAGVGFDAEAVRGVDALGRTPGGRRPGDLAFARVVLGLLRERRFRFDPVLEVEGLGRAAFAIVVKSDVFTYAGARALRLAPEARFELGLDLVAPRRLDPRAVARVAAWLATGRARPDRLLLTGHDLDRIVVRCDEPLALQADGEDLGDVTEAVFEAERGAIAVLV